MLVRLEEEKGKDRQLELEMQFKEQELKEKSAFQRVLTEAEERAIGTCWVRCQSRAMLSVSSPFCRE